MSKGVGNSPVNRKQDGGRYSHQLRSGSQAAKKRPQQNYSQLSKQDGSEESAPYYSLQKVTVDQSRLVSGVEPRKPTGGSRLNISPNKQAKYSSIRDVLHQSRQEVGASNEGRASTKQLLKGARTD